MTAMTAASAFDRLLDDERQPADGRHDDDADGDRQDDRGADPDPDAAATRRVDRA